MQGRSDIRGENCIVFLSPWLDSVKGKNPLIGLFLGWALNKLGVKQSLNSSMDDPAASTPTSATDQSLAVLVRIVGWLISRPLSIQITASNWLVRISVHLGSDCVELRSIAFPISTQAPPQRPRPQAFPVIDNKGQVTFATDRDV